MSTPKVLVWLVDGAEEMEAVIAIDVLRRAGADVVVAGLDGEGPVTCSRQVRLVPDAAFDRIAAESTPLSWDLVVIPGGAKGAERLAAHPKVQSWLKTRHAAQRPMAAVCAGPTALAAAGVTAGFAVTSHPSVREQMSVGTSYREERVVVDRHLITSRGPGTAMEFALACVTMLFGADHAAKVAQPMLART